MGLLTRFGTVFLSILALYELSLSTRCTLVETTATSSNYPDATLRPPLPHSSKQTSRRVTSRVPTGDNSGPRRFSLTELVDTKREVTCDNDKLVLVNDARLDTSLAEKDARRIPKIIHVTSKSRCMTKAFADNVNLWKQFPDHSFFFHNDEALDRLLMEQTWPEFPHLSQSLSCIHTAAGKADLWRALVLYEFGGIYTDIDNAPRLFNASSTITPTDQAFFVVENEGMLSQYFMAAAPRHPLFYLLVQTTLHRLLHVPDVETQYVPFVTGPGALKSAFIQFMRAQKTVKADESSSAVTANGNNSKDATAFRTFQKVRAGVYTGLDDWTVTVVGRARQADEYVARNVIYQKRRIYRDMGMTHFSRTRKKNNDKPESCLQRLYRLHGRGNQTNSQSG